MKYTDQELQKILKRHKLWLKTESFGEVANLSCEDLSYANLKGADLREAYFSSAILRNANFIEANLSYTKFSCANLIFADLSFADLTGADLRGADLRGANLEYADLRGADIKGANLKNVDLRGALNVPFIPMACPDSGSFIGWKLALDAKFDEQVILKLFIPSSAKRSSATTRKCRCNKAKVLEIQNIEGDKLELKNAKSIYNRNFKYKVGEMVSVPNFDEDRWNECSTGIHFFINRQEAVDYGDS